MQPSKNVHLICQAKGGVGKSFFTYLVYQKTKPDATHTFIDLDNANQTTSGRLPESRVKAFNALDHKKKINREAFLSLFEHIASATKHTTFWIDMGATESIEFLNTLTEHYSPQDLAEEFKALNVGVTFNVVIAGGDAYTACVRFLTRLREVVHSVFPIAVWVNTGKFNRENDQAYFADIQAFEADSIQVRYFGSTDTEASDASLLELIKSGHDIDPARLNLATRIKYRKLLNEITL